MYYFIVNPNSRGGLGYRIWTKLKRHLDRAHVEYQVYLTANAKDASKFAHDLTEGVKEPRTIVAVGGDGTMNEVLDGVCFECPVTFGYIPSGSGNDLARSLHLPKNPVKALKRVLRPKAYKLMDYGVLSYGEDEISNRRFVVSAGIGLDAAVCHSMLHSRAKDILDRLHVGRFAYILMGIRQLLRARPVKGYLLLDGVQKVEFNHIFFVSAHIHPYEGGGFQFAPRADYQDGKLTVCVLSHLWKGRVFMAAFRAFFGKGKRNPAIRVFACRELAVHMERPMAVHADGESCFSQTDVEIRCIEKKIRIIM